MRIFLIGYMCSGKTTLGKKLASRLGLSYLDMDRYIEEKEGRSVSEIFSSLGEEEFRRIESDALREIIKEDNLVVSTGGGTPVYNNNMDIIKRSGLSIYLKISPQSIIYRHQRTNSPRPLLSGLNPLELKEYIEDSLSKREVYYNQADIVIKGESLSIDDLLMLIEFRS